MINEEQLDEGFDAKLYKFKLNMSFRIWIEEIYQYTGTLPKYNMKHYFNKNKWWLKNIYKIKQKREANENI